MIEGVVYINLAHRTDRKTAILSELAKIHTVCTNIHRIEAVLEPMCGHLGCGKSHVNAIELAIHHGWDSVLIVEDDMKFTEEPAVLSTMLTQVFDIPWNVVLLGLGHHVVRPSNYAYLETVVTSSCAHGYIIRKEYYTTLLDNFKVAVNKMTKQLEEHIATCKVPTKLNYCSAIDQEWFSLQRKDTFYAFTPQLCIQNAEFYSDNNCSIEYQTAKITKST
jgi:GR25 family glycosyltransferase involved in LPS biosynthesis